MANMITAEEYQNVSARDIIRMRWATTISCAGLAVWQLIDWAVKLFSVGPTDTKNATISLVLVFIWGLIFLSAIIYAAVNIVGKTIFGGSASKNDEWNRLRTQEARAFAYKALLYVFVPLPIVMIVLDTISTLYTPLTLEWSTLSDILFCLVIPALFLPNLYLAWTAKPLEMEE